MTLRHLRIFRQVWREGSVTKAASVLGMTQPSVSIAIGELEEFYQVRLFDRISRKMYLTPSGERLIKYADAILTQYDESINIIRGNDVRRELKVGITSNFAASYAPLAMKEFNKEFPDVKLVTYAYASSTIVDMLGRHEIDIGILDCEAPENVNSWPIYRDEFVLLCSKDYAKRLPETVAPEDLKGVDLIYPSTPGSPNRPLADWLQRKHVEPNVVLYASGSHAMNTTARAGLAVLPILRTLAMDRVKYYPDFTIVELRDERPELVYTLCVLKGKTIDEPMKGYIEIMSRLCNQEN